MRVKAGAAACLLLLAASSGAAQHEKDWRSYYPLAKGNVWTYEVVGSDAKTNSTTVDWKVANRSTNPHGVIFTVWQKPLGLDATSAQLQPTPDGLHELIGDFFPLRFPLHKGRTWTTRGRSRAFTVVSEGEPCSVGKLAFQSCAVVRDEDNDARLRTVTTYALGVGPVRYEYYDLGYGSDSSPAAILNLVVYSLEQDSK